MDAYFADPGVSLPAPKALRVPVAGNGKHRRSGFFKEIKEPNGGRDRD